MSRSEESLPPEHLEARLVALSLHLQALSQLLLPLEGAVREDLGENRALRAEIRAAKVEAARTHPLLSALGDFLSALGKNPEAIGWIGRGIAALLLAGAVVAISRVSAGPGTMGAGILAIVQHYGGAP